jgi:hypothetical protein
MSNYTFYKLVCKDDNIKDCYVGQTTDFIIRYRLHKSKCSNVNSDKHHLEVYKCIRLNGGWDNWEMIEIENCNLENDFEARNRERYWIKTLEANLNCIIPNRTDEEYYQEHIEHITEYKHNWYEKNKERTSLIQKQYYIDNKKRRSEVMKKYYEKNKEKIIQQNKERYERKKLEKQQEKK